MSSRFRECLLRYTASLAALAIPMAITAALKSHPTFNPVISASFLLTISAVSWWAGTGAGILLSCLTVPALTAAATGGKNWLPPHVEPVAILIFCFISFLVGRVASTRKRIEEVLRTANSDLEAKVRERTAELQNANAAVQHRLAELETLYAQLPVGLCFLDTNLRFLRINEKLAAINHAPVAGHLHRHLREMISAGISDIVEPWYRRVLETGKPVLNFELSDPTDEETDQQRTWLIDCSPVRAADGRVLGLQVICQDITERKHSEQLLLQANAELARRENELRTLANAIPQICWVSNADGSVAWYNDRWYEYTGAPAGDTGREHWEARIDPESLPALMDRWKRSLREGQGFELEIPIRGRDGRFRWFLTRTVPIHNEAGQLRQWFGTSTDVDEIKRSREALLLRERELQHANSDLQQFAYSASHDLQEPIRTIAVYAQLLERRYGEQFEGDAKEFLTFVCASARRMETLVHDLLQYVQTTHLGESVTERVEAADALRDALANLSTYLEETRAEVSVDALPALRVRRSHLQQVFQNLVGNALKYRGTDPPKLHISARRQNEEWLVSVQDNGIGIDATYQQQIFGIFKRLHTADKYSGTGIGLAICQRVIERYGGRIWVESEVGKGSTFFFTIPD